jgi:nanoRNase/pAp phosphatase (c-di-AMP/oligoRNAs hydrolase)
MIKCSFRRQDRGEDVSVIAKKIVEEFGNSDGGGHKAASGCIFPSNYFAEFMERLKRI